MRSAMLLLLLLVACKGGDRRGGKQGRSKKPPADAARVYTEADLSSATYMSIDEVAAAGNAASGKLAVVNVSRDEVRDDDFTAYPCKSDSGCLLYLTLPDDMRDLVRAMPRSARGSCPRVLVRILSIGPYSLSGRRAPDGAWVSEQSSTKVVEAETLFIADVTPQTAAPTSAGVQFSTFDDIVLSKFRGGEVAELTMQAWRSQYSTHVTMTTCDESRDSIEFPDEKLDGALAKVSDCRPIRFKLRRREGPGFGGQSIAADLVSIGTTVGGSAKP
jgi:hypothetical protein